MKNELSLLDAALAYAAKGKPVFPCSINKTPLTAHGHKDASTDPDQIRKWWKEYPGASIGMPTGPASGCWLLDVDFPDGPANLDKLVAEHGALPETLMQKSGSGAFHRFFKWNGASIRCKNGVIAPNIDVKGEGGYVIVSPSPHPSGGRYEWLSKLEPAIAPDWLINLIVGNADKKTSAPPLSDRTTPYGSKALRDEAAKVALAPEGTRNDALFNACLKVGGLVAGGNIDRTEAEETLLHAAVRAGLKENEARKTIGSGLSKGADKPRGPEEKPINHPRQDAPQEPKQEQRRIVAVDIGQFLSMELRPREPLLAPWLPRQGLAMAYAYRGVGKTFFALSVGYAVASGGLFLGWQAPQAAGVLYLDGEMPSPVMQERLAGIVKASPLEPQAPFILVTPDLQPEGMPRLDTTEGQAAIDELLTDDIRLVIVDNISTLTCAKENEADGWTPAQAWALRQRAHGRAVLFIHHANKSGSQRGTSRREDVLDSVLALRRPVDYQPDQGAVFEVHYEKARGLWGDEVSPIEARLVADDSGNMTWTTRSLDACTFDKVVALLNEGLTQKEVADELGINKSTVSRHARRAKSEGLVQEVKK